MDRELKRQLSRIEGKVNAIAKAMSFVLAIAIGFVVFFIASDDPWAPYVIIMTR